MNILKKIQEYFLQYDKLDENGRIYANHTPLKAVQYSIIELPSSNGGVVRSYIGGDALMQFQFSFDTKVYHSTGNDMQNFDNSHFYTQLQDWVFENNRKGVLPDIENCQEIEILQTGYLKGLDPNGQFAVHSMSGRVTYYKEREKAWLI